MKLDRWMLQQDKERKSHLLEKNRSSVQLNRFPNGSYIKSTIQVRLVWGTFGKMYDIFKKPKYFYSMLESECTINNDILLKYDL